MDRRKFLKAVGVTAGATLLSGMGIVPYSSIYNEVTVRARRELDNDIRPALVTRVENIDEYDTLIVGTPIWSSRLAPPVKSFLAMYDLAGKKIAPRVRVMM